MISHTTTTRLIEFSDESDRSLFLPIDDRVMGGVSSSALVEDPDGGAVFKGIVSLENNGGFASVRASLGTRDLSKGKGVLLRALGDGKRYNRFISVWNRSVVNPLAAIKRFTYSEGCSTFFATFRLL